jgi:competence protein ComEC
MPQPESGLLEGILLGLENDIPSSLKQAYRDTGASHIIAISGFNMTLIATLLIVAFSRVFRRYWGVLAAIVIIAI